MSLAPVPGVGRRAEQAEAAKAIAIITVRGDAKRLAINNVPMREKLLVRKSTGMPYDSFLGEHTIGLDSLIVLWWLARRAEGETTLTFDQAVAEFPEDITEGDIDLQIDEPEGEHPEA